MGRRKHLAHRRCPACDSVLIFCKQDCEIRPGEGAWADQTYWWYRCGCEYGFLVGNTAYPFRTYVSSKWNTEGATRVQVGNYAYGWGAGWKSVLHHRPTVTLSGHQFQPRNHDFRKDHGGPYRAWYVARFVSEDCPAQPLESPPPARYWWGHHLEPYRWATWTDYDGVEVSGFIQRGLLPP